MQRRCAGMYPPSTKETAAHTTRKDQDNVPLGWNIWQVKRTRGGFSGYCSLNVRRSAYTPPVTEHSHPTTNKWSMKHMHMRRETRGHDHDTSHQKQRAGAILSEHRRGYSVSLHHGTRPAVGKKDAATSRVAEKTASRRAAQVNGGTHLIQRTFPQRLERPKNGGAPHKQVLLTQWARAAPLPHTPRPAAPHNKARKGATEATREGSRSKREAPLETPERQ